MQYYWPVFIEETVPYELLSALLMLMNPDWREMLFVFMNKAPKAWRVSYLCELKH